MTQLLHIPILLLHIPILSAGGGVVLSAVGGGVVSAAGVVVVVVVVVGDSVGAGGQNVDSVSLYHCMAVYSPTLQ